jgi:hypothetical protein
LTAALAAGWLLVVVFWVGLGMPRFALLLYSVILIVVVLLRSGGLFVVVQLASGKAVADVQP